MSWTRPRVLGWVGFGVAYLAAASGPACEVRGKIQSVKPEEKSIVVLEQGTAKEVVVRIGSGTALVTAKGTTRKRFDLDKLSTRLEERPRGLAVVVEMKDGVAEKVTLERSRGKAKGKTGKGAKEGPRPSPTGTEG